MSREKVYIVNKEDVVLAEKWRDELTDTDCWRIVAIWIETQKVKFSFNKGRF